MSVFDVDASIEWDRLDKPRFLAWGGVFSFAMDGTLHPFEVIKTRLQVQGQPHVLASHPPYESFRDAVRQIGRHEGVRGYFKGFVPAAAASIPVQILYYGSYEYSRYFLSRQLFKFKDDADLGEFFVDATAGAVGEIVSGAFWVPADLVSQRLMLQGPDRSKHLYTGMRDAVRKIWAAEGPQGFYVGFGASLLTHIPNSAVTWAVYEYTRKQLYRHWWWPRQKALNSEVTTGSNFSEHRDGSHLVNSLAALVGGVFGSAVSTPFDVIRVRKQAEGLSIILHSHPAALSALSAAATEVATQTAPSAANRQNFHNARVYRGSTLSAMRTLVADTGVRGLFRGIVPRCLAAAPQSALALVAYEMVKNLSKLPGAPTNTINN